LIVPDARILSLADLPPRLLAEPALSPLPGAGDVTNAMLISWASQPDLREALDLDTAKGRNSLRRWCRRVAAGRSRAGRLLSRGSDLASIARRTATGKLVPGVNLVGYLEGVLGMGEHVRMTASAMAAARVPAGLVNFTLGLGSRRQAVDVDLPKIRKPEHRCNLFHINADQMVRTYWHLGPSFFAEHYNIGYWAWELSNWPQEWTPTLGMVDEIWAPSRFVRDALAPVTRKPVELMPLCVELPTFTRLARSSFGLAEDDYVFLFSFDCHSYVERKNPAAAVRAFLSAFPRTTRARLVIKAMHAEVCADAWQRLKLEAAGDDRILLIDDIWPRERVLALVECCDAYVSLHRSEGFGRGPAEAMLMGKPVIATDYSGTTDFCRKDNALLVDYRLVPVPEQSYVGAAGQVWADPSVETAAGHMAALFDDPTLGRAIGARGRQTISEEFSSSATGQRYRRRLVELGMI
jgi:glycosyltransferase involved in cell wall biosynthesis